MHEMKNIRTITLLCLLVAGCADVRTETSSHANGYPAKSVQYRGEQRHGPWREWNEQGQLTFEAHYVRGNREGTMRRWRDDGSLSLECEYLHNMAHGTHTEFSRDGSVRLQGTFENDKPVSGLFSDVFYHADTRTQFGGVMEYREGQFVRATLPDGSAVSNAYHIAFNPGPGEDWNTRNEQHVFLASGIVQKVTDVHGRELPREAWREDFR
jgi:hypothetical protein